MTQIDSIRFNGVCIGRILGPQGLKGEVRIRSYTSDPMNFGSYGSVSDDTGDRKFDVCIMRQTKKGLVARINGIESREAAEKLSGLELYVARQALPKLGPDEFYFSDLIGLVVEGVKGDRIGVIKSIDNFGASDLMDIELFNSGSLLLPISLKTVPVIDLDSGRVVIDNRGGCMNGDNQTIGENR